MRQKGIKESNRGGVRGNRLASAPPNKVHTLDNRLT